MAKAKVQPRKKPAAKKPAAQAKKKRAPAAKAAAPRAAVSPGKRDFAKVIWPHITDATTFVDVAEFQTSVTYTRASGEPVTATLKWYKVTLGPRILGHYDDEGDVCYIGQFSGR